jgi:hypothetical protein
MSESLIPGLDAPCGWCQAVAGYYPGSRPYLIRCAACGEEGYLPSKRDLERIDRLDKERKERIDRIDKEAE